MNRLLAVAFILFCFEIGLFLVFVPWSQLWEHNVLLGYSFHLRGFLLNNFLRGAVSGLGLVDLVAKGIPDLAISLHDAKKKRGDRADNGLYYLLHFPETPVVRVRD